MKIIFRYFNQIFSEKAGGGRDGRDLKDTKSDYRDQFSGDGDYDQFSGDDDDEEAKYGLEQSGDSGEIDIIRTPSEEKENTKNPKNPNNKKSGGGLKTNQLNRPGQQWVVLIAGSNIWDDYRHQEQPSTLIGEYHPDTVP